MKTNKKFKQTLEPLNYNPELRDIPLLTKLIEEFEKKDGDKYFHFDVDKKGRKNI